MEATQYPPKYAVTHSGRPHADDMMAGAILRLLWPNISIIRKPSVEDYELYDSSIIVFDIGGKYDKYYNNFDHHQNRSIQSACALLWKSIVAKNTRVEKTISRVVLYTLLNFISNADKGVKDSRTFSINAALHLLAESGGPEAYDQTYEDGVEFCLRILQSKINSIVNSLTLRKQWKAIKKIGFNNSIKFIDSVITYICDEWKMIAAREGVHYIVVKEQSREGLPMLVSLNGAVPVDQKRQCCDRSQDSHVAYYRTIDGALNHALELSLTAA